MFCSDRYGNVAITTESRGAKLPKKVQPARRKRADGELSRERILDAATEIAAERGYEGASIALVSAKCGLPASSIYWHFTNKDDLIAAVIERSFADWLAAWQVPDEGTARRSPGGHGDADRESTARLARFHSTGPDVGFGAPSGRAACPRDVHSDSRADLRPAGRNHARVRTGSHRGSDLIYSSPTRWPAPTDCSLPRRSAATQWI